MKRILFCSASSTIAVLFFSGCATTDFQTIQDPMKTTTVQKISQTGTLEDILNLKESFKKASKEDKAKFRALEKLYPPKVTDAVFDENGELVTEGTYTPHPKYVELARPISERLRNRTATMFNLLSTYAERNPNNVEAWDTYASYAYDKGDLLRAAKAWEKAVVLDPDNADFYNNIGCSYSHTEFTWKSIQAFRKAIELDPDHPEYRFNLGTIYFTGRFAVKENENRPLDAIYWLSQNEYEKAYELEPVSFRYASECARNYIGARYFGVENIEQKAIDTWLRCLDYERTPRQKADVYLNVGRWYRLLKQPKDALEWFQKAKAIHELKPVNHLIKKAKEEIQEKAGQQ